MRKLPLYLIVFCLSIAIAGCGTRIVTYPADIEVIEGLAGADAIALDGSEQIFDDTPLQDNDLLAQNVVYFTFNSSRLNDSGKAVVQAHAQYLKSTSDLQIVLEGHADERGTREYNLALAENRAKAVADLVRAFGVSAGRIQPVSYGEERPVALTHDEKAWRMNRRVEILYQ